MISEAENKDIMMENGVNEEKCNGCQTLSQDIPENRCGFENYKFPTIDLLDKDEDTKPYINVEELNKNKDNIIRLLNSFGIEVGSIRATAGPVITLYEVSLKNEEQIIRVGSFEDDIILALKTWGARIIAPIPGKNSIGIEIPNSTPKIVSMLSVISSREFQESSYELPVALGKTVTDEVFIVDLSKMPNMLLAGAARQGKSSALVEIISSLIYKKHPSELKFVMIDPGKVELSMYSMIEKHFLARLPDSEDAIVSDPAKIMTTLNSVFTEIDSRCEMFKAAHVSDIREYNHKFISRQLDSSEGHKYMPYIVVIISELGDLVMNFQSDVERMVARIARRAHNTGVHLIIATEYPTQQVITGEIKSIFPVRVAFRVASMADSRTVIDKPGANQLIGAGDMLFKNGNSLVRVQCASANNSEVDNIVHYIARQQDDVTAFYLPAPF